MSDSSKQSPDEPPIDPHSMAPHPPTDPAIDPAVDFQTEAQTRGLASGQKLPATIGAESMGAFGAVGSDIPAYAERPDLRPRRTLLAHAVHETFRRPGARIGLIWICFIGVLAVFAPLIASSFPITMVVKGQRQFPLLWSLRPVDVLLLALFFIGIGYVAIFRPRAAHVLLGALWIAGVAAAAAWWPTLTEGMKEPWVWLGVADKSLIRKTLTLAWFVLVGIAWLGAIVVPPLLLPRRNTLALGVVLVLLTAFLSVYQVRPPQNVIYDSFRRMEATNEATGVLRTIVPYSANDRGDIALRPPDKQHWMGTNVFREDVLSRMIHATRIALAIGFIATGIATLIGITFGGMMGYFSGWIDLIGMRFVEIVEAIPRLIILLIVMVSFGRNIYLMMVTIGLVAWTADARFIRAEYLKLRRQEFVQAAQASGLPLRSILFRHMLPNGVAPVLVNVSFGVGAAILIESVLSFLGLGLLPEDPSWGQLLNQARSGGTGFNWWIAVFPGSAIFLTVFSFILIGEAMRDAIDPKLKKAGE